MEFLINGLPISLPGFGKILFDPDSLVQNSAMAGLLVAGYPGTVMNKVDPLLKCPKLLYRFARCWNATELVESITCEWSSRLRRSLGHAYPERKLIRLSLLLNEGE